jgi:hypothetical protein
VAKGKGVLPGLKAGLLLIACVSYHGPGTYAVRYSRTTALTGHFDVFAQVACGGNRPAQPPASLPPGVPSNDQ